MPDTNIKMKMVIATLGLEVHWRGAVTVARLLRDCGVEVVFIGNAYPDEIIQVAMQEGADIVGVSSLTGGHLILGSELMEVASQKGIKDNVVFVIGGIFPPGDLPKLKEAGFDGTFGPEANGEVIYTFIKKAVSLKQKELPDI